MRGYPCNCQWPEHCDSQQSSLPPTRMAQKASHPQPAAPALPHDTSAVSQQSADALQLSSNSLQSAPDYCSDQPLQPPAGRSPEAGDADLAMEPSETMTGKSQLEGKHSDSPQQAEAELQRLEQEFVHDVYNAIAPHFSATRFAIWPKVMSTLQCPWLPQ